MRADLAGLLCCPDSRAPLELVHVGREFALGGRRHVAEGLLAAPGDPERLFPIVDEIPRLLPKGRLLPEECAYLDAVGSRREPAGEVVEPLVVDDEAVAAEIRRRMEKIYELEPGRPDNAGARARCEGEIGYMKAEHAGRNKKKYLALVRPRQAKASSLLEVGGNFPGLTRTLAEFYAPSRAVVANLQILFPIAFKTAKREIDAVRADVQLLPFRDRSFDLLATAFMLEHVPDWRRALGEMTRVADAAFIAFGPNKLFPIEVGHLDAPLAGTLPRPLAAYAAWTWKALTGQYRPLWRVREILGEVFHVASPTFRRQCRRLGLEVDNLFPELVDGILNDADAPRTKMRRALRAAPGPARLAARTLTALGMEPQIYCFLRRPPALPPR